MPRWMYWLNASDRAFAKELVAAIAGSGRYRPLTIQLPSLRLTSAADTRAFCERNSIVLVVQHDSMFYSNKARYRRNVEWLEACVPFINSTKAQTIGHNKITTKRVLRERGIPVLDERIVHSVQELAAAVEDGTWYVLKPPHLGAGRGVKLITRGQGKLLEYQNGKWRALRAKDFVYDSMMLEPYFNDDAEGFASLRCTVIGSEVAEAVKRVNAKNITSNVSSGGRAQKVELSQVQKEMAVAAMRAIGAEYAGVDLLVSGNKSVVGEINIGPFTIFGKYTGVPVGRIFADYLIKRCDGAGCENRTRA